MSPNINLWYSLIEIYFSVAQYAQLYIIRVHTYYNRNNINNIIVNDMPNVHDCGSKLIGSIRYHMWNEHIIMTENA